MKAEIKTDDYEGTLFSSGIWDGFSEMLDALINLAYGIANARCNWQEESGQYTWIFKKVNKELHIKVVYFETNFSNVSEEKADQLFEYRIDFHKFAMKIINKLEKMLYQYGEKQFERIWKNQFPRDKMATLRKLLKSLDK